MISLALLSPSLGASWMHALLALSLAGTSALLAIGLLRTLSGASKEQT
jgi:hypothetical protein